MIQGTTPVHAFHVDIDTSQISVVRISYEQNGKIVLYKETPDCDFADGTIGVKLTQEETLKFDAPGNVRIQIHALIGDESIVSKPVSVPVYILLDKVVLSNGD